MDYTQQVVRLANLGIFNCSYLHLRDNPGREKEVLLDLCNRLRKQGELFSVFLLTEPMSRLNNARNLWIRFDNIGHGGARSESTCRSGSTLIRVGLLELRDVDEVADSLFGLYGPARKRVVLRVRRGTELRQLNDDLAASALDNAGSRRGPVDVTAWLIRAAQRYGAVVVVPEDNLIGQAGLGLYGDTDLILQVRDDLEAR